MVKAYSVSITVSGELGEVMTITRDMPLLAIPILQAAIKQGEALGNIVKSMKLGPRTITSICAEAGLPTQTTRKMLRIAGAKMVHRGKGSGLEYWGLDE
jgi:hypothetical protein